MEPFKPCFFSVSFITNLIKNGDSPEEVRRMTGHASDEMIRTVYAQLTDEEVIRNLETRRERNHSEKLRN